MTIVTPDGDELYDDIDCDVNDDVYVDMLVGKDDDVKLLVAVKYKSKSLKSLTHHNDQSQTKSLKSLTHHNAQSPSKHFILENASDNLVCRP